MRICITSVVFIVLRFCAGAGPTEPKVAILRVLFDKCEFAVRTVRSWGARWARKTRWPPRDPRWSTKTCERMERRRRGRWSCCCSVSRVSCVCVFVGFRSLGMFTLTSPPFPVVEFLYTSLKAGLWDSLWMWMNVGCALRCDGRGRRTRQHPTVLAWLLSFTQIANIHPGFFFKHDYNCICWSTLFRPQNTSMVTI